MTVNKFKRCVEPALSECVTAWVTAGRGTPVSEGPATLAMAVPHEVPSAFTQAKHEGNAG
jgi:hypothetical protein